MTNSDNNPRAEDRLQFFGKITASVTHEINNVFSVINENSGLLSDWLKTASKGKPLDPEKLARVAQAIQKHLGRGQEIIGRLNRFSHSVDQPNVEFDLAEALENIVALSERLAYRKKATLERDLKPGTITVESSPFLVRQTVFNSIMFMLQCCESIETISVTMGADKDVARIIVKGLPWSGDDAAYPELSTAAAIAGEIEGTLETRPAQGEIIISLPRRARLGS